MVSVAGVLATAGRLGNGITFPGLHELTTRMMMAMSMVPTASEHGVGTGCDERRPCHERMKHAKAKQIEWVWVYGSIRLESQGVNTKCPLSDDRTTANYPYKSEILCCGQ
jgi:hypothetical protein